MIMKKSRMIRRPITIVVFGTLIAALVVYAALANGRYPATRCTSRDCGASDHVSHILAPGNAKPHLGLEKQDLENVAGLSISPSKDSLENDVSIYVKNYNDTREGEIRHRSDVHGAENRLNFDSTVKNVTKQDPRQHNSHIRQDTNDTGSPSVSGTDSNLLSDITEHRRVRQCVSGDVLGAVSQPLQLLPFGSEPFDSSATEESHEDRQKSFQHVFNDRLWLTDHGREQKNKSFSASGGGSTFVNSQEMVATLHKVIDDVKKTLGISLVTLLDVPCGDLVWMHRFLQTRDDVMYTGMDIVPEIIWHHQHSYPSSEYPHRRFIHADIVTIPELGRYHVVLSRMMMQHLQNAAVHQVLHKISSSGSHYALMTTLNTDSNRQLQTEDIYGNPGRFRYLNLEIPPYSLEPPLCLERDGPHEGNKDWLHFIGLWKLPLQIFKDCPQVYKNEWKDSAHFLYSCTLWK